MTWHFPPQSPPSHSFICLSTAALALGLLHNPYTPAPSHCAFQETFIPVRGMYDCGKDCLILIPFRLPQVSCFTLSLKYFSSDSDNCPDVGIRCLLQFPHPPRAGPVLLTLLFSPLVPSSYRVLHGSIHSFRRRQWHPISSTLAWKIPWTAEPGRLQSMGSLRVRHDLATSISLFTFTHWRRKWQPTPVFLPGESQGWRSLVGCRLWGHTESDTTEVT